MKRVGKDWEIRRNQQGMSISLDQVDRMDPFCFELLLGMIYQSQGYIVKETPKTGDQGADVFIEKAGERSVVQAKLYSHPVGNKAVQEVVAARIHYRCQYAILVSNTVFTPSSTELATSSNVKLVAQTELLLMLH